MTRLNVLDDIPTENAEQCALFTWAQINTSKLKELALLHAIPNGGYRSMSTAKVLKMTGVKAGVPDMFLPVARKGFHGLYIELKRIKRSALSAHQAEWIDALKAQGYKCEVCKGWIEARDTILGYLLPIVGKHANVIE